MRAKTTMHAVGRDRVRVGQIALVVVGWCATIAVTHLALADEPFGEAPGMELRAPPLHGVFDVRVPPGLLVFGMGVGALLVLAGPRAARRASWGWLLVGSAAACAVFAIAVALVDGSDGLTRGVLGRTEYLTDVRRVGDVGELLRSFPDLARDRGLAAHTSGHPPGILLALVGLDRVGLGGAGWTAALFIVGGALSVPPMLVAARDVAGEAFARRAAPFVVVAPAALWLATSADALFAGVSAWAAMAVVVATRKTGRRSDACAIAGGLGFGAAAFLSYGLVLVAAVPLVVAIARRRARPVIVAAISALPIALGFLAAGFSWFEGLAATRDRYGAGIASQRPYLTFLVVNLVVLALVVGPIGVWALGRLRDRAVWLVVGGAAGAVAIADLSGMSKAEVERIWLPFALWLLLACGGIVASDRTTSGLLAVQATATLIVSTTVVTAW